LAIAAFCHCKRHFVEGNPFRIHVEVIIALAISSELDTGGTLKVNGELNPGNFITNFVRKFMREPL